VEDEREPDVKPKILLMGAKRFVPPVARRKKDVQRASDPSHTKTSGFESQPLISWELFVQLLYSEAEVALLFSIQMFFRL